MIPEWLYFLFNPALLNRYGLKFIDGFLVTFELVFIACSLGFFLGMFITFVRLSNNKLLRYFAHAYVYFFRGSPLLAQLFLFYYGLGSMNSFGNKLVYGGFSKTHGTAVFSFLHLIPLLINLKSLKEVFYQ